MADEDILKRIIEIEREGREALAVAQAEANARVAHAREEADQAQKRAREEASRSLESASAADRADVELRFRTELQSYQEALEAAPLDETAFDGLVAGILESARSAGSGERP